MKNRSARWGLFRAGNSTVHGCLMFIFVSLQTRSFFVNATRFACSLVGNSDNLTTEWTLSVTNSYWAVGNPEKQKTLRHVDRFHAGESNSSIRLLNCGPLYMELNFYDRLHSDWSRTSWASILLTCSGYQRKFPSHVSNFNQFIVETHSAAKEYFVILSSRTTLSWFRSIRKPPS